MGSPRVKATELVARCAPHEEDACGALGPGDDIRSADLFEVPNMLHTWVALLDDANGTFINF
eukprot:995923-Lingulodinium_polyedra.AAC.1